MYYPFILLKTDDKSVCNEINYPVSGETEKNSKIMNCIKS